MTTTTQTSTHAARSRAADYILALTDPGATLETVGGKGASLARLAAADLPVPTGFYVTTRAYYDFIAANDLQPEIDAALADADVNKPSTLETAAHTIQRQFNQGQMPDDIASAIAQAYARLPGDNPPVAVRSSATAEDLPEASFAGQQETFLNVRETDAVLEAVKRCWTSLWTARAIGYRARQGIPSDGISLAVVVQAMVLADAAGILFTANPVTGARDQAVINAAWGLGEAIVGGHVTPDSLTVNKQTGEVVERETAVKTTMTVRTDQGTAEQPVPDELRDVPVLDDASAAALVWIGTQIETLYGRPMDIEWTLADGAFAIVQARPITALPAPAALVPQEWPMPDAKAHYTRGSIVDFLPDPLSPLYATLGLRLYNAGLSQLVDDMLRTEGAWPQDMLVTINDYAYMGMPMAKRKLISVVVGMVAAMPRILRDVPHRWRDEALPAYREVVTRWEQQSLTELSATELLDGVRQVFGAAVTYINVLQAGPMGAAAGTEMLFTTVYDRLIGRDDDPRAAVMLLGFDSIPLRAEKSLFDLAHWCGVRPALESYLLKTPSAQIAAEWKQLEPPADVDMVDWQAWQGRLRDHLRQYGHAIYDLDFAKPLPADSPTPILESLRMYLQGKGSNPYRRQHRLATERDEAVAAMRSRIGGVRRRLFDKTLGWAQMLTPMREDCIAEIGLGYPVLRAMLAELGARLVGAGGLAQADDVYWLEEDELETAVAHLDRGAVPKPMQDIIEERLLRWRAEKRAAPPPQLPLDAKFMGIDMQTFLPEQEGSQAADSLKGLGASPGCVTGTARVLHGPADFDTMRPGDVLVASITTPAWTPLFAMASAIVTDVGGPLSHGSIVAREYGIPAVLGTGVATRRIRSGETITVDGDAGVVTLSNG